jgi:hypothetical protein
MCCKAKIIAHSQVLRTSLCESSAKVREAGDPLHHVKDLNEVSTSSGVLSSGMVAFASS